MRKFRFVFVLLALTALQGCTSFRVDPSDSDLQFSSLATVWDEAMPLGNAVLGELVWQKEEHLRFSLDRIDLWDLRPTETHVGEHYSFDWVKAHIRSGDYAPVLEKFARPAEKYPAPSKIPGAALEVNTASWGAVTSNRLYLKNALCEVDWENGTTMRTFVQADGAVGWILFENVPEAFDFQLVPPAYQDAASAPRRTAASSSGRPAPAKASASFDSFYRTRRKMLEALIR